MSRHLLPFTTIAAVVLALAAGVHAGQPAPDAPLVHLEEGKTLRLVNSAPLTGKDVLDLLVEENWEQDLQVFIEHIIRANEIEAAKVAVPEADVDAELKALLEAFARKAGMDPKDLNIEKVAKQYGVAGGVSALRRHTQANLGMLKIFQKEGQLKEVTTTNDKKFQEALRERLEKLIGARGVVRDPKQLGPGEAVRIGGRGYSRDEVRAFMLERLLQIPKDELHNKLEILTHERLVQKLVRERGYEMKEDDLNFHFSYLCRRREIETGVPGRLAIRQDLQANGMTPEEFLRTRLFRLDSMITLLAKKPIGEKQLKEEFANNTARYKQSENLIAHIFIPVLDPDGRPYGPGWQVPGHEAVNAYVARKREEQFEAAKPEIEGLVASAKADFEGTAKKYSRDRVTKAVGGKIGRIGAQTFMVPPCDLAVRDAAVKLKPGEVSGPVRSVFGWHLLKCLEQQDVTFDEAAERVYANLIFEGRKQILDSLKNAKVEDKF